MLTCIFIDWENIEKTVKQDYGAILQERNFIEAIRRAGLEDDSQIVGIYAYGDFEREEQRILSKLMLLGVTPKHDITKSAREYLKNSADIELNLDIMEMMFTYPHIDCFFFISGDSDMHYVMRRLRMHGKKLHLMGFKQHTSNLLTGLVDRVFYLDDLTQIYRKVTSTEKEKLQHQLLQNKYVPIIIKHLNRMEQSLDFVSLNYLRRRLLDRYPDQVTMLSDALTQCLESDIIIRDRIENPHDPSNPTTSCRLARENPVVKQILAEGHL